MLKEVGEAKLTRLDLEEIGKKAYPIECSAAHGYPNPQCVTVAWDESGDYVYEYLKDTNHNYWFREFVKGKDGKLIPFGEAVFGPIKAKAEQKRRQIESEKQAEVSQKRMQEAKALREKLAGMRSSH